jgi:predicted nucleic acid-binding protein
VTDRGVLDTSVFIAAESGRRLDAAALPAESAISVVTLAELQAGVLAARDIPIRAIRLATVEALSDIEVLPVDAAAALVWAQLRVQVAESGRRINLNDLWIAATAASRGVPVVTQDDDFGAVEGMAGLVVVRV